MAPQFVEVDGEIIPVQGAAAGGGGGSSGIDSTIIDSTGIAINRVKSTIQHGSELGLGDGSEMGLMVGWNAGSWDKTKTKSLGVICEFPNSGDGDFSTANIDVSDIVIVGTPNNLGIGNVIKNNGSGQAAQWVNGTDDPAIIFGIIIGTPSPAVVAGYPAYAHFYIVKRK